MKRKAIPLAVKVSSCLLALGLDPDDVDWHHSPSLGMRPINPETGDTIPPQLDPRHIVPLERADHKRQTFGDHVPLSGDVQKIKKLDRVEKDEAAFRDRVLRKLSPRAESKYRGWGKRKLPSRPFQKRSKP